MIEVVGLVKKFKLKHYSTFFEWIFLKINSKKTFSEVLVLNNINFKIDKGRFVGIIGKNGSGKSTLLKLLANVYGSDSGRIVIDGSLRSILELEVGFNDELKAIDNVYFLAALFGIPSKEVNVKKVFGFAELEGYENVQVKKFSTGMKARLAFATVIQKSSDVLVLDEILSVGDKDFEKKCVTYFKQFKDNKGTLLLTSHNLELIKAWCDEVVVLNEGKVYHFKNVSEGLSFYKKL